MEYKGSLPYHKRLFLCPSLKLMNPIRHVTSYSFKIRFNFTLLSMPRLFKQYIYFFFSFPCQNLVYVSYMRYCMPHTPACLILYLARYKHHEVLHYAVLSVLLLLLPCRPSIFLNTLFSNTINLCFSPNLRDQDPHPYIGKSYSFVYCNCYELSWLVV